MGETVELTIWPKHQDSFYRISSSAFSFDVKATGNALIGLSKKPGGKCYYWICIGDTHVNRSWIRKEYDTCDSVLTPRILSRDEYRRFWLTWFGETIELGRHGETTPIISRRKHECDLKFVTFTVLKGRNPVHWRFEVPPQYVKPIELNALSCGRLQWLNADNQLPDGAVIGGFENETLYIVRAPHRESLTPGKFVPSEGVGYVSWGGAANEKNNFEVLCGFDCVWEPSYENRIPVGAVEGGYSEDGHERLYVGRAYHEGHLIPGKVQPTHNGCYIPYKGQEISKKFFEILVQPQLSYQYAHKFFIQDMKMPDFSESDDSNDGDQNWNDDDEQSNNEEEHYAVAF